MLKVIGIIPARIGSGKQKNIKKISGKTLIEYTFEEVKKSNLIDDFIVSSDSSSLLNLERVMGYSQLFKTRTSRKRYSFNN